MAGGPSGVRKDKEVQSRALGQLTQAMLKYQSIKIGNRVKATVQLVKDYGLIVALDGSDLTGFIVNEQKSTGKTYKVGTTLECVVLDIDTEKKIVDLSERLVESSEPTEKGKPKEIQKAFVELSKENYMIISMKSNRKIIGVCVL